MNNSRVRPKNYKREGQWVTRVSNTEEVKQPQPQHAPCFQISGIRYPNRGIRKDFVLYIKALICVKRLNHLPQVHHEWNEQKILNIFTEKTSREVMRDREKGPIWGKNCRGKEDLIK